MRDFLPVVSVTMIAYNHGKYIRQAVESVFAQKTNFDFEVIVGEDCSPPPDKSREILLELKEKYGERLVLLLHEKNLGVTGNGNSIAQRIRGKYFATLECDDYWTDTNKLQRQYDFLETHPEYSACGSDSCSVNDDGVVVSPSVLCLKKDKTFTINDYKRDGFTVHGNTLMKRNSLFPRNSDGYKRLRASSTTMGDIFTLCLLYSYGPIYVFKDVMHAHRLGRTVASSFSANQRTKLIYYSYMQMNMAKALDDYFNNTTDHSFIVVNRLAEVTMTYLFFRKEYTVTWAEVTKLYSDNPTVIRIRAIGKTFYRVMHRGLRKIKRKLMHS